MRVYIYLELKIRGAIVRTGKRIKKLWRAVCLTVPIIGATLPANAQVTDPTHRVLYPVLLDHETPGRFGSRWITELAVTNVGSTEARLKLECRMTCPVIQGLLPGTTSIVSSEIVSRIVETDATPYGYGAFYDDIGRPFDQDSLRFSLRVRDISRDGETWGSALPVITERDWSQRVHLLDFPLDDDSRTTLRIYSHAESPVQAVVVTVFEIGSVQPDALVGEFRLTLQADDYAGAFAQVGALATYLNVSGRGRRFRLSVQSDDLSARLFAFATVTNNETQHVSVVTSSTSR